MMFVLMAVRRQFFISYLCFEKRSLMGSHVCPMYVIAFIALNCVNYSYCFTGGSRFKFQFCSCVLILDGFAGTHLFTKDASFPFFTFVNIFLFYVIVS